MTESTVGILWIPCPTCGAPIDGQCETTAVTYEPRPRIPHPARIIAYLTDTEETAP